MNHQDTLDSQTGTETTTHFCQHVTLDITQHAQGDHIPLEASETLPHPLTPCIKSLQLITAT